MPYQSKLAKQERAVKVIYLSSYIPRKCGLASYTKDLTTAINILNPQYLAKIIAVDNPGANYDYPWEVSLRIQQNNLESYQKAADFINQSSAEVVNIQHEFGLYGGKTMKYPGYFNYLPLGDYILTLMKKVKKPIVTTFHTVLPKPPQPHLDIVRKIVDLSKVVTVMVNSAVTRLIKDYRIPRKKIVMIHHGVPDFPKGSSTPFKRKFGFDNWPIIAIHGLLNPGKGLEYVIEAMPKVVKNNPKAKFLIIGETHPEIKKQSQEKYRYQLKRLAKKYQVERSIKFVNKYLELEDLILYLKATDIYITPYLNPEQIASGSLAYAVGAGKACISTPYLYAKEVLAEGRGILVDFKNSNQITEAINYLVNNSEKCKEIGKKAYAYGKMMIWHNVALKHLDLFNLIAKEEKKVKAKK